MAMSQNTKESLTPCTCSISTSGYGSSVHYHVCPRCEYYRSSMTRVERLTRERSELINGVRIYLDILKTEPSSHEEAEAEFRARLRLRIGKDVRKIREISRQIGPVRPVVSDNSENHE